MKNQSLFLFFLLLYSTSIFSQIGIGTTSLQGDAILQLESDNKGLLIPRVVLSDLNTFAPLTGTPIESLMVYNTSTITGPGYFYWSISDSRWTNIDGGRDWRMGGNAPTAPGTALGENYVGSTDNERFILATNRSGRMFFSNNGLVSVNNNNPSSDNRFTVTGSNNQRAINGYALTVGSGVRGENYNAGIGVKGVSVSALGVRGGTTGTGAEVGGVTGKNTNSNGTAMVGVGNNRTEKTEATGSGGAFIGAFGVAGFSESSNPNYAFAGVGNGLNLNAEIAANFGANSGGIFKGKQWGVSSIATYSGWFWDLTDRAAFIGKYVSEDATEEHTYIGARNGGTHYKLLGNNGATVSTTMLTANDGERILFVPESPENWFFDVGEVQLVNGMATVNIDPLFLEVLSQETPFKVFVQGGENTLGNIELKRSQRNKSFTLKDQGGSSNGTVYYKIYGIWKGKEGLRFPELKSEDFRKTVEFPATKSNPQFNSEDVTNHFPPSN